MVGWVCVGVAVAQPIVNSLFWFLEPAFFGVVAFSLAFAHAHLYVENRWCVEDVLEDVSPLRGSFLQLSTLNFESHKTMSSPTICFLSSLLF
jgi:hypothetical protein